MNKRRSFSEYSAGSLGSGGFFHGSGFDSDYSAGPLTPVFSDSDGASPRVSVVESSQSNDQSSISASSLGSSVSSSSSESSATWSSDLSEGRMPRKKSSFQDSKKKESNKGQGEKKKIDLGREMSLSIREQAKSSEDVMRLIKERFETTDKNKNGWIDAEEFRQLVKAILGGREVKSEDFTQVLKQLKVDTDGNGRISYDEFVSFMSLDRETILRAGEKLREQLLRKLNGSEKGSLSSLFYKYSYHGKLRLNEFRAFAGSVQGVGAKTMTEGELSGLMAQVDKQGKGHVTLDDLQIFLESTPEVSAGTDAEMDGGASKNKNKKKAAELEDFVVVDLRLGLKKKRKEEEDLLAEGYTRLTSNLNERGRGSHVHLFVKRANVTSFGGDEQAFKRARVTDIALSRSKKDQALLTAGYQCVMPYHTNQGAWFVRKQYLWFRRNVDDKNPVVDVAVTTGRSKDLASKLWTPPFRGYKRIDGDLNAGNRGHQVFLWYFKHDFDPENQAANPHREFIKMIRDKFRDQLGEDGEEVDLDKLWEKFDRQGRGWLSRARMRSAITATGIALRKKDLDKVIDILDVNHDNRIDKEEFMEFISFNPTEVALLVGRIRMELTKRNVQTKQQIKAWFMGEGKHKRTTRNAKEFTKLLKRIQLRLSAEECKSLMGRFDRDGDGLIDVQEFVHYMLAKKVQEEETLSRKFVAIESAARHLRSFARNYASPDMNYRSVCDHVFQNSDRLTKQRLAHVVRDELGVNLSHSEVAILLLRVGTSRHKFIEFCSSTSYIDAVLNVIADAALKQDGVQFFQRLDADGNGRLSREEFATGLKHLKLDGLPISLSNKEIEMVIEQFDQDGDGEVDLGEFLAFINKTQRTRELLQNTSTGDLLDEEEHKLGDPRVLYVLAMLRKMYLEHGRRVEPLYSKIDLGKASFFSYDDLVKGLERLGIVPQEVHLSAEQLRVVFRRLDIQGRGRVTMGAFHTFLRKAGCAGGPASPGSPTSQLQEKSKLGRLYRREIKQRILPVAQELEEECHALDAKGSGHISKEAFLELVHQYASKRAASFLVKTFASKSVKRAIDYEELFEWLDTLAVESTFSSESVSEDSTVQSPRRKRRSSSSRRHHRKHSGKSRRRFSSSSSSTSSSSLSSDSASYSSSYSGKPRAKHSLGLSKRLTNDLHAYSRHVMSRLGNLKNLKRVLKDYASFGGKVSRDDFNDAMEAPAVQPFPKALWKACFKDAEQVSQDRLCKVLASKSSRGLHSPLSSRSSEEEQGFGGDKSNGVLSEQELTTLLPYVSQKLSNAANQDGFSWENAVRMFDVDGSGTIRLKELVRVLKVAGCEVPLNKLRRLAYHFAALRENGTTVNYEHFFANVMGEALDDVVDSEVESKVRSALRAQSAAAGFDLESQLNRLDMNGDGKISASEFAKALPKLLGGIELSPAELNALIRKYDVNRDGKISLEEFSSLVELKDADIDDLVLRIKNELRSQARHGKSYAENFRQFDLNGDGKISRREFRKCLEQVLPAQIQLSNTEMRKLMDRFDVGKTGKIDYHSFCELCAPSEIEMLAVEKKVREKIRSVSSKRGHSVDLKHAFKLFDLDENGKITRREFQQACDRLGLALSEDELGLLLQRFDTSGTGNVDYFEFCRFVAYDDHEVENLMVRAGKHLDLLQHDQVDPVAAFSRFEGTRNPLGLLARHAFHRACKDLKMPFSDSEVSALADLFADSQDSSKVKYRDFCLSCLGSVGAMYQGRMGSPKGQDASRDLVWNPDTLGVWLKDHASPEMRAKFMNLHNSMSKNLSSSPSDVVKLQGNVGRNEPSQNRRVRPNGLWECPVCFYKQTKAGRTMCEMCDSPFPGGQGNSQWPHIKPLLDDAYNLVGHNSQFISTPARSEGEEENSSIHGAENRSARNNRRIPSQGEARWFSNPNAVLEDEGAPSLRPGRSRKHSEKKHRSKSRTKSKSRRRSKEKLTVSSSPGQFTTNGEIMLYSPRSPRYY